MLPLLIPLYIPNSIQCQVLCCDCEGGRTLLRQSSKPNLSSRKHSEGHRKLSTIVLDFEGLGNLASIGDFYNGGGGPNYGVAFSDNALALIDFDAGGDGNFANEPSPSTILFFLSGTSAVVSIDAGFDTGFSFFYTSPTVTGSCDVYDGVNGTGNILASLVLPPTNSTGNGDPTGSPFDTWTPIGVTFTGIAKSVGFGGVANNVGFDDITFGSATPGNST